MRALRGGAALPPVEYPPGTSHSYPWPFSPGRSGRAAQRPCSGPRAARARWGRGPSPGESDSFRGD